MAKLRLQWRAIRQLLVAFYLRALRADGFTAVRPVGRIQSAAEFGSFLWAENLRNVQ